MPVTKIKTEWIGGDLSWKDNTGSTIARWNSTAGSLEIKKASGLDFSSARNLVKIAIDTENSTDPSIAQTMLLTATAVGTTGAAGATHNIRTITPAQAIRVMDVVVIQTATGNTNDTLSLRSTGATITDEIDISGADKTVKRAGTIDDAQNVISSTETISIKVVSATTSKKTATCDLLLTVVKAS